MRNENEKRKRETRNEKSEKPASCWTGSSVLFAMVSPAITKLLVPTNF